MKNMIFKTNQNPAAALAAFFRFLLEEKVVDALLLPQEVDSKTSVVPTLVKDARRITAPGPWVPVSLANTAKHVSDLTFKNPEEKLGVVLRPCEVKALVELVKLNQASTDQLVIIGVDCLGTFHPVDYRKLVENGSFNQDQWLKKASKGEDLGVNNVSIRKSCEICDAVTADHADIHIGWVGADTENEIVLQVKDELAPALEKLGLKEGILSGRDTLVASLKKNRAAAREKTFKEFQEKYSDINVLMSELATCLRCQNCRKACPICFCRQCVFESMIFEHDSDKYLKWASRKGLIEMPTDTVLFHLTRLNHMATSCVGCGQCESACPSELPLATIFQAIGKKVQDIFEYVPGRSLEENLPLTTYKEVELEPR